MTLCVTSLKNNFLRGKEINFSTKTNDIVYNDRNFKDYLKIAFAQTLSFDLGVFNEESHSEDEYLKIGQIEVLLMKF